MSISLKQKAILERWGSSILPSYGTPQLVLARGEGCTVWDVDGVAYLDAVSGIAVNALGHAHPRITQAVTEQLSSLAHVSNLYANEPCIALAERLLGILDPSADPSSQGGRVFFCNSGAEANETAFKLARLTGRPEIVSTIGSFHGRTLGALALTGQPAKQEPFAPLPGLVTFVPFGDVEALRAAVTENTAAVFLEPVQGEGGIYPAPDGYLNSAREITSAAGALLVLDEIQTGLGRTGSWFAHQKVGIHPDVVTLAKSLGGGLPLGACVALGPAASLISPGQHGSTFGGNPVCCAAALAVLDVISNDGLVARAEALGSQMYRDLEALQHQLIGEVRGAGLLIGVQLTRAVAAFVETAARGIGLLVNAAAPDVIRLAPPLVLTDAEAKRCVEMLHAALDEVQTREEMV
jgi:acetylornithine aminotransferase